eukprot:1191006-Pyramimonas_sp.AAC.1
MPTAKSTPRLRAPRAARALVDAASLPSRSLANWRAGEEHRLLGSHDDVHLAQLLDHAGDAGHDG